MSFAFPRTSRGLPKPRLAYSVKSVSSSSLSVGTGTLVSSLFNKFLSSNCSPSAALLTSLNVPGVKAKSQVHELFSSVYGIKPLTTGPLELTNGHGARIMQEQTGQVSPEEST